MSQSAPETIDRPGRPPSSPPAGSETGEHWRVGKRVGQMMWQIKEAPGWRVAHQVNTLEEAAAWLQARGVDSAGVAVLTAWPWLSLAEHVANKSPNVELSSGERNP